jgi:tetratricopeptide (TPR) repeat protein
MDNSSKGYRVSKLGSGSPGGESASVVEFQQALGISPLRQHAGIYHRCAAILARLGRAPEALDYLQKGLALNDEALQASIHLADSLFSGH